MHETNSFLQKSLINDLFILQQKLSENSELRPIFQEKTALLNSPIEKKIEEEIIRARFNYFNESDTSSIYVFELEKKHSKKKCLSHKVR